MNYRTLTVGVAAFNRPENGSTHVYTQGQKCPFSGMRVLCYYFVLYGALHDVQIPEAKYRHSQIYAILSYAVLSSSSLLTTIELSLGGSSPYASTDKTNYQNTHTLQNPYTHPHITKYTHTLQNKLKQPR